jgi:hypothetical protein
LAARRASCTGRSTALERAFDVTLSRTHPDLQFLSSQVAFFEAMPILEHQRSELQQLEPDAACGSVALTEGDVLAQQVRVAHLPQRHRPEAEDRGAITDEKSEPRTEHRQDGLAAPVGEDAIDRRRYRRHRPQ